MAQAILEIGWGKYILGNNLFGIKAQKGYTGAKSTSTTSEYIKGKRIEVKAEFRAYTSFEESMLDHGKLLGELKRYANVKTAKNYDMACRALQASGYPTDPLYAEKLVSIIENNRLYQYDKIEKSLNQDTKDYKKT